MTLVNIVNLAFTEKALPSLNKKQIGSQKGKRVIQVILLGSNQKNPELLLSLSHFLCFKITHPRVLEIHFSMFPSRI
jgi:hypothetical protein